MPTRDYMDILKSLLLKTQGHYKNASFGTHNKSSVFQFFSSVFLLLVLNILIKPLWIFAIDRQVQNITGIYNYGKYFSLFNLTIVFNFLLDCGITTCYNQRLSSLKNIEAHYFSHSASLKLILGVVYALAIALFALITGVDNFQWLSLLAIIQFLFSVFLFLRSHITGSQLYNTDAWLSITDKVLMIILCGILIYKPNLFGPITIMRFMILQIFSILVSIGISLLVIFAKIKRSAIIRFRLNFSILKKSWPYGLIVLLMSAINRQDAFILERLHKNGDYETGIYASAYRLLDAANMIGFLVTAFLLSYVSRNWDKKEDVNKVVKLCRNFLLVISIGTVCLILATATPLQKLLYHVVNPYQVSIIRLCIPALVGYALVQVYGTVLTASGNIKLFVKLSIPFFVANLVLNTLLTPEYGALACCFIAIITQVGYGLTLMMVARQKSNPSITNAMPIFN